MKVFISWSGDRSKALAAALNEWLPQVLQSVTPFYSPKMDKGIDWMRKITAELNETRVGIICVTPENSGSPWLLFESGALYKALPDDKDRRRVIPIALGYENAGKVRAPLGELNAMLTTKDDFFGLVQTINGLLEPSLSELKLQAAFEKWWPDLEKLLSEIPASEIAELEGEGEGAVTTGAVTDMFADVLTQLRELNRKVPEPTLLQILGGGEPAFRRRATVGPKRVHGIIVKGAEQARLIEAVANDLEHAEIPFELGWDDSSDALEVEVGQTWAADIDRLQGLLRKRAMDTPWQLRIKVLTDDDYFGVGFDPDSP